MIGNYSEILPSGAVLKEKGVLIFSEDASQTVLKFFGESVEEENTYDVRVILIDPGHGGRDPGTSSTVTVNNIPVLVEEKNINLDVSLRLAELLREKYPEKEILLTRTDDSYPTLEDRVKMANGIEVGPKEGIIYISVHVNASLNRKAEGYEIWHLPGNYRREVVDRDVYEGDESLIPVVNSILEERYALESIRLARNMLEGLDEQLPEVPNRGLKEESWFVVRNTRMAAVLVELGYITNKDEALRMMQTSYLKKLTNGLYNGINRFIDYYEEKGFD
nr:N-acetylmuramoyl-L-alanine amidase [Spirochaeta isovalerica]